jgi:DNA-binding TFAR19-related protein (PDSD5 family)
VTLKKERLVQMKKLHQSLDDEADKLSLRRFLTPNETQRWKKIKILRLHLREEIEYYELGHALNS